MPLALLAAAMMGLVTIVLFVGLAETHQAERRAEALKSEIERVEFNRLFLRERGQEALDPELDRRLEELRAELAELQQRERAARQKAREEAEEIRQGIRSVYAPQKEEGRE